MERAASGLSNLVVGSRIYIKKIIYFLQGHSMKCEGSRHQKVLTARRVRRLLHTYIWGLRGRKARSVHVHFVNSFAGELVRHTHTHTYTNKLRLDLHQHVCRAAKQKRARNPNTTANAGTTPDRQQVVRSSGILLGRSAKIALKLVLEVHVATAAVSRNSSRHYLTPQRTTDTDRRS